MIRHCSGSVTSQYGRQEVFGATYPVKTFDYRDSHNRCTCNDTLDPPRRALCIVRERPQTPIHTYATHGNRVFHPTRPYYNPSTEDYTLVGRQSVHGSFVSWKRMRGTFSFLPFFLLSSANIRVLTLLYEQTWVALLVLKRKQRNLRGNFWRFYVRRMKTGVYVPYTRCSFNHSGWKSSLLYII